ncbi:hypothetical protein CDD82_2760 [Ophiocordyceps australis]|uniref:SET domain-containing protein n=1 Tax=Ophiocordyceps australis TaxID=1399860 RepID=A0A2C5ZGT9_9HYPO|nr:hypothetical protein CDD82_2760 [Ophiocordyceps australis]
MASANSSNLGPDRSQSTLEPHPLPTRLEAFGSRKAGGGEFHSSVAAARAALSPPPLARRSTGLSSLGPGSVAASSRASPSIAPGTDDDDDAAGEVSFIVMPRRQRPALAAQHRLQDPLPPANKPLTNGAARDSLGADDVWTLSRLVTQLQGFRLDVKEDHARLTAYVVESTKAAEHRIASGVDIFAGIKMLPVAEKKGTTMRIRFKQHLKAKKDQREECYLPVCTKTTKDRVPRYRFHHVAIKKNVLTPNTMLTFVPHLRDLESSEETKYNLWLKELEEIDLKSGFKPMNREEKRNVTHKMERAATISLYLNTWLESLQMPACNKSALIRLMATKEPDDAITPQQKTDLLTSHREASHVAPLANKAAQLFTEAFQIVFKDRQALEKQVDLRSVLLLDESVDSILESKPTAKDGAGTQNDDEDELAESNLATYCILGCLICFSHSCDHGEYDNKNLKRTFSISSCSHLSDALKRRRQSAAKCPSPPSPPCQRDCYRHLDAAPRALNNHVSGPWLEDEVVVLRSLFTTASHSAFKGDAICLAADFLDRSCSETFVKFESLGICMPRPRPLDTARPRNLPWYDRRRKTLMGDWQDHTVSHEHQRRETLEPCSHEGPCQPRHCSCVDADVLCDKFCGCTEETCAYKFTGCACHSQGKTCFQKQKDRPCICVQLNRECDPQLCGSCGALERADPLNAHDGRLHATGCQNCDVQRGLGKSLILGQSQLEGVGYGLFTAEDIVQDDFIVEYVGELITHDEGVRREARRGDVFDEDSNISYVFTLLEHEGIWVDAAIYGNLSRYINHASEHDKRGCNITPRILYVNGEYRIKFTAMRDIKAGEELFFNYGENFPNLTKKLLDTKASAQPVKSKTARSRRTETVDQVARKAPRPEQKRGPGRPRIKREVPETAAQSVETPDAAASLRKRKRPDDQGEAEYKPAMVPAPTPVAEASTEPPEGTPGALTRLRKRNRALSGLSSDGLTRPVQPPKKKGKRGGARPGSGRPRKHPRPIPKAGQGSKIKLAGGAAAGATETGGATLAGAAVASEDMAGAAPVLSRVRKCGDGDGYDCP